jgi:hypothetical protein
MRAIYQKAGINCREIERNVTAMQRSECHTSSVAIDLLKSIEPAAIELTKCDVASAHLTSPRECDEIRNESDVHACLQ